MSSRQPLPARASNAQPIESRITNLESDFQTFAASTLQRFDTSDARQASMDQKLGLLLDRTASITAQEGRLPKNFVSQAIGILIGLASLMIAVTGVAASVGAMYVNLQVARLDREDTHQAERITLVRDATQADIQAALGPLQLKIARLEGHAEALAMAQSGPF